MAVILLSSHSILAVASTPVSRTPPGAHSCKECKRPTRIGRSSLHISGAVPFGSSSNKQNSAKSSRLPAARASDEPGDAQLTSAIPVWEQKIITLPAYSRGCHVITREILERVPELLEFEIGMANLFIQHTSASLTINENASPDVPKDLNDSLDRIAPEGKWYRHSEEGADDMPAHVKSSLMSPSLDLPIKAGQFALGTWQGIYLNEHRNHGGARRIVVTVQGRKRADGRAYPANQYRW